MSASWPDLACGPAGPEEASLVETLASLCAIEKNAGCVRLSRDAGTAIKGSTPVGGWGSLYDPNGGSAGRGSRSRGMPRARWGASCFCPEGARGAYPGPR